MNFSKVQEPIVSTGCDVRRLFIIPRFLYHITKKDGALFVSDRDDGGELLQYTHTMDAIRFYVYYKSKQLLPAPACLPACLACILVCSSALILELRCRNANAISLVSFRSYAVEMDTFSALRLGFQHVLTLIFHTVKHVFKMLPRKCYARFQRSK